MFEEFIGRKVVVLYKDNDKTYVLKGTLLKVDNKFLTINDKLQGITVLKLDVVLRVTEWDEDEV